MHHYDIREIDAATAAGVSRALIRDGIDQLLPESAAALHVGGFSNGHPAGVATIYPAARPWGLGLASWRLSGVAVEPGHRGRGLGLLLVERCLDHAADHAGRLVWCLSPRPALGFFERLGFEVVAEGGDGATVMLERLVGATHRSWRLPG